MSAHCERGGASVTDAAVVDGDGAYPWPRLVDLAAVVRSRIAGTGRAAVLAPVRTGGQLVTVLLAARGLRRDIAVLGPEVAPGELPAVADCVLELDVASGAVEVSSCPPGGAAGSGSGPGAPAGGLWVFSSGTAGRPVATRWSWPALTRAGAWAPRESGERWAIGYAPYGFAGIQATCQALGRAGGIEFVRPDQLAGTRDAGPLDVVTGTPSFWRMAAIHARRTGEPPRPIGTASTGGEPVDASLLELLRTTFRPGRVKQIFATTELGTVVQVDDGLPGLPLELCGRRLPGGAAYLVRGDRLVVSAAPGRPFAQTGDLVRVADGRVHVLGRDNLVINVGGHKVDPAAVTRILHEHPRVLAARTYAIPSPVLGSVVAVDVVVRGEPAPAIVDELKRYARGRLAPHQRPRRIRLTAELAVARSGKVSAVG
jgi:acyl-coenzyme A synthetase/AMP-(fatty) acid ligase